ncbi:unnamed protein product [Musa acuminata var. zebrina]
MLRNPRSVQVKREKIQRMSYFVVEIQRLVSDQMEQTISRTNDSDDVLKAPLYVPESSESDRVPQEHQRIPRSQVIAFIALTFTLDFSSYSFRSYSSAANSTMAAELGHGNCLSWAARNVTGTLSPYRFDRRSVGADDISLKIKYCGVCFADVVWTRNKHGDSMYPLVPGHEIVGVVTATGSNVKGFKVGDHIGVGTYVNSCRNCEYCDDFLEVFCSKGPTLTFNGLDSDGTVTKGGYSSFIVVHERYCYKIPDGYPLDKAAPLLCAGITVYSPMMRHKMNQPGKSLGVIGLGGQGHMAVKFGKAFGLKVTVFSTSESKKEEALNLLRADNFVISSDKQQMMSLMKSLDYIIDTASGDHPFDPYMSLLKVGGVLVLVGFPSEVRLLPISLNMGAKSISGSMTGGTKETQEMLNFCATNQVYPEVEVINIQYINEALERLIKRDVKYRFVIDIANSLN